MDNPRDWIGCDESAGDMLARLTVESPALLLPPLHRVPLRAGNIVEIVGPSPSAKSEILLQATIHCILPKEWNGVHFGGLERMVIYFDLDCRFDVLRLAQCLKHRLMQVQGIHLGSDHCSQEYDAAMGHTFGLDDELFQSCMRRFLYTRCYNSLEFLAALKTIRYQLQKEAEAHGVGVHSLMIDSISAFYWMDRCHQPLPSRDGKSRKSLSLQSIMETITQEIHKLLQVQQMLVLATKATIFGVEASANESQSTTFGRQTLEDTSDLRISRREPGKHLYREYMPSAWQLFVTHRIFLRVSDENFGGRDGECLSIYTSEWVLPPLHLSDRYTVNDVGIVMIQ